MKKKKLKLHHLINTLCIIKYTILGPTPGHFYSFQANQTSFRSNMLSLYNHVKIKIQRIYLALLSYRPILKSFNVMAISDSSNFCSTCVAMHYTVVHIEILQQCCHHLLKRAFGSKLVDVGRFIVSHFLQLLVDVLSNFGNSKSFIISLFSTACVPLPASSLVHFYLLYPRSHLQFLLLFLFR